MFFRIADTAKVNTSQNVDLARAQHHLEGKELGRGRYFLVCRRVTLFFVLVH